MHNSRSGESGKNLCTKRLENSGNIWKIQDPENPELLEAEVAEIKIIDSYLPKQLSEEETKKICKEIIEALGASSIKDMGKIMGTLKKKYAESIDFSKVNLIIKDFLK